MSGAQMMMQARPPAGLPVPGAILHVDPSDTSTITASGGVVSQVLDKARGLAYVQATSVKRPTTGGTINGRNALTFANSQVLVGPLISSVVDNFSMYVVVAPAAAPLPATVPFHNGTGTADGYGAALRTSGATAGALRGGVAWHHGVTTAPAAGVWILSLIRTAGTAVMRLNNGTQVTFTAAPNVPTTQSTLGAHNPAGTNGDAFLNGKMGEALFWDSAHSETDRASVQNYLASKWGITL